MMSQPIFYWDSFVVVVVVNIVVVVVVVNVVVVALLVVTDHIILSCGWVGVLTTSKLSALKASD